MIKIFSSSNLSALPSQAVSTIRLNIFGRLNSKEIEYHTTIDDAIVPRGAVKKVELPGGNRYLRFIQKIRAMRRIAPDVIMLTGEPPDFIFYLFRPKGTKTCLHLNGSFMETWFKYPFPTRVSLYWTTAFLLRHADFIIGITRHSWESVRPHRKNLKGVSWTYNGVDLSAFRPDLRDRPYLSEKYGISFSRPTVLYIGMLVKRKRPELFIRIARSLPEYDFVIVGAPSGDYDLSGDIAATPNLRWVKQMDRTDIAVLLASVDLFLFPAVYEGFGMVLAEAMASGCPVLVSKHHGPGEIVESDKEGIAIEFTGDGKELESYVSSTRDLLENPEMRRRMGEAGRLKAEAEFDWDKLARDWKKIILSWSLD